MNGDRRGAPRHSVPEDVSAEVAGVVVRLLELSLVGAKVEHCDRFTQASPRLSMTWRGDSASVEVRPARSEIVGRQDARLVFHTGLHFVDLNSITRGFISSIFNTETLSPEAIGTRPLPPQLHRSPERMIESLDNTWTRRVNVLKEELDDDFPYAQFRLTGTGWRKEYVDSPIQPADGFTVPRDRCDFDELQRTFEAADSETRRMMQIALESLLRKTT